MHRATDDAGNAESEPFLAELLEALVDRRAGGFVDDVYERGIRCAELTALGHDAAGEIFVVPTTSVWPRRSYAGSPRLEIRHHCGQRVKEP